MSKRCKEIAECECKALKLIYEELHEAAEKAAKSGTQKDLTKYLELRSKYIKTS